MILLDSSALIEYFRPRGLPHVKAEVRASMVADLAAVNGIIQAEVVTFAPTEAEYLQLLEHFSSFHWLDLSRTDFDLAAELGFRLRRKAITVPPNDLIIAASAIRVGAPLLHLDAHFDLIAQHSELKAQNLRD